ncbi:MAG: nicotinamide mononucleotide transporter [Lacibacter sp.]
MNEFLQQFIKGIHATTWYESMAVFTGIASVWFSRKEHILVYPIGLINTITYIFICAEGDLFGEMSVNFYYTIMNIYGWYLWLKKDEQQNFVLHVSFSDKKWAKYQIIFFAATYIVVYISLLLLKKYFYKETIPFADAFATATAFTGMWLMTKKKVESWYWWIATNIVSIPLYFVKHYVFTSVYYLVLLVMAVFGLITWMQKAKKAATN